MLDDWSGIDLPRAVQFIQHCRVRIALRYSLSVGANDFQTYEGGYAQQPFGEAIGISSFTPSLSQLLMEDNLQAGLHTALLHLYNSPLKELQQKNSC